MGITHNFNDFMRSYRQSLAVKQAQMASDVKALAVESLKDIQSSAPVDLGRFMASNFLEIDGISRRKVRAMRRKKGTKGPLPYMTAQAQKHMEEAVAKLNAKLGTRIKGNMSITIVNNLPYAQSLENGHSKQAPKGVYALARQRARRNARKLGIKWK